MPIIMGHLCYRRNYLRITPLYLPNHKSWEVDEVKAQLGKKMAAYFFQGAAEMILPGKPALTIVESKGAVPKKGKDTFSDISDAREGKKSIQKWRSLLFTARDLACSLLWRVSPGDLARLRHQRMLPHLGTRGVNGQAQVVWGWGIVGVRRVYDGDTDFVAVCAPRRGRR
jgi:hypothetical protein